MRRRLSWWRINTQLVEVADRHVDAAEGRNRRRRRLDVELDLKAVTSDGGGTRSRREPTLMELEVSSGESARSSLDVVFSSLFSSWTYVGPYTSLT